MQNLYCAKELRLPVVSSQLYEVKFKLLRDTNTYRYWGPKTMNNIKNPSQS